MLALLCSGQGGQHPRMFDLTGMRSFSRDANDGEAGADALFAHARRLLGDRDPVAVAQAGAFDNRSAQILCTLQGLAASIGLAAMLPCAYCVAGYSVGEVAAWGVAGRFSASTVLDLVAARAALMNASSDPDDGLLFIRGLSREQIERVVRAHGCAIAIENPGNAWVVGGPGAALTEVECAAMAAGATHTVHLPVAIASHTPKLTAAAMAFRAVLAAAPSIPADPVAVSRVRLFSGIDGEPVVNVRSGLEKLAAQIAQPVLWRVNLEACVEAGATAFLELGPGRALSDMATGAYPHIPSRSLDDFTTWAGVDSWLARVHR